jgi:hypothetical protein
VQFDSIVMANCKFGCDELFGRGYVDVDGAGAVTASSLLATADHVADYMSLHLRDRPCAKWVADPLSRGFFEFHFDTEFKAAV